ncbi:hypothetical protein [Streptomyces sp. NRRL F-5053]|uniref:hypothetical protein n=1 Tax=Streptomyces sp. NRRL F-5053 TaxID=1463854 RepID=UPI0004CBE845|nr:hypothetical protein [Streptomyces sp. NRRL F-5053]
MSKLAKYRPPSIASQDEFDGHAIELELGNWAYALDDAPGVYGPGWYPFHRVVMRREFDPENRTAHVGRDVATDKIEPRAVRISPDKEFLSWRNEYVTLHPYRNDARVKAVTNLFVERGTVRLIEIAVDLREQTVILPDGVPDALREQAEVKGQRVLHFLNAARSERRRGLAAPHTIVHRAIRPADDEPMLVIGRTNDSPTRRRQQRFASVDLGEAAITRWANQGYSIFWTQVGDGPLAKPFRMVDGERAEIDCPPDQ